ncbi:MAG TPA: PaaI family thioesterase [Pyrinomonadaceae bacterium]|jgi:uncharacterized protein (TIGR00369 family)|nr:PaaI family thioesterase [Pyrinomonadaceae bacterium]
MSVSRPHQAPPLSPAEVKRLRADLRRVPFAALLGIKFVALARGDVTMSLRVREETKQNNGTLHGGALGSLLDTASAFAVISTLRPGETTATVDLTISYLRPIKKGQVTARARVLKEGRRLLTVAIDAEDADGRLAATALCTFIRHQSGTSGE